MTSFILILISLVITDNTGSIKPEISWKVAAEDRDGWRGICLAVWSY